MRLMSSTVAGSAAESEEAELLISWSDHTSDGDGSTVEESAPESSVGYVSATDSEHEQDEDGPKWWTLRAVTGGRSYFYRGVKSLPDRLEPAAGTDALEMQAAVRAMPAHNHWQRAVRKCIEAETERAIRRYRLDEPALGTEAADDRKSRPHVFLETNDTITEAVDFRGVRRVLHTYDPPNGASLRLLMNKARSPRTRLRRVDETRPQLEELSTRTLLTRAENLQTLFSLEVGPYAHLRTRALAALAEVIEELQTELPEDEEADPPPERLDEFGDTEPSGAVGQAPSAPGSQAAPTTLPPPYSATPRTPATAQPKGLSAYLGRSSRMFSAVSSTVDVPKVASAEQVAKVVRAFDEESIGQFLIKCADQGTSGKVEFEGSSASGHAYSEIKAKAIAECATLRRFAAYYAPEVYAYLKSQNRPPARWADVGCTASTRYVGFDFAHGLTSPAAKQPLPTLTHEELEAIIIVRNFAVRGETIGGSSTTVKSFVAAAPTGV
jgi:hypothetical protein